MSSATQSARYERAEPVTLSPMIKIAIIALLTPVYFRVGPLLLDPGRVVFLILTPYLLYKLFKGEMNGIIITDYFLFLFAVWFSLAIFANHPIGIAVTFTYLNIIYVVGGYLVARYTVRNHIDFFALIRFLRNAMFFLIPFAVHESITDRPLIIYAVNSIPGVFSVHENLYGPRHGLFRAQVVFSHPIHFGYFCSLVVGLYYVAFANQISAPSRLFVCAVMLSGVIFSVSSGPLAAVLVQAALIGYWIVARGWKRPWRPLLQVAGVLYVILELASTRPLIYALAERIAFNPATANVRRILFDFGMQQFWRSPILGIGHNPIPMPHYMTGSVDNYWLMVAVLYGFPALVGFAGIFVLLYWRVAKNYRGDQSDWDDVNLGIAIMLTGMVIALATVAIWLNILSLTVLLLGASVFIFYSKPEADAVGHAPPPRRRALLGDPVAETVTPTTTAAKKPARRTVL